MMDVLYNSKLLLIKSLYIFLTFWDFVIETEQLMPEERLDLVIVVIMIKKNCHIVDFVALVDQNLKFKESKNRDKYVDLDTGLRKLWEHHRGVTICNWNPWNEP